MWQRLAVRDPEQLAFVTQTTLSVDDTALMVAALRERFPSLQAPRREDICYATQNRQDAVKKLLARSAMCCSWSARAAAPTPIACASWPSAPAYRAIWWTVPTICSANGSMARRPSVSPPGASAPEVRVQQVVQRLRELGRGAAGGARRARGAGGIRSAAGRCAADAVGKHGVADPGSDVAMAAAAAGHNARVLPWSRSYNRRVMGIDAADARI